MNTRSATSANANGMFRASSEGAIMSALNVSRDRDACERRQEILRSAQNDKNKKTAIELGTHITVQM